MPMRVTFPRTSLSAPTWFWRRLFSLPLDAADETGLAAQETELPGTFQFSSSSDGRILDGGKLG
jgi:hypothetical protein